MRTILIALITFYQQYLSILLSHIVGTRNICRYEISCSAYAKQAIQKKGAIIGLYLASRRILSCQPFLKAKHYGKSL